MENEKLLEFAKNESGKKQIWFGTHPQFDMDIADIEACTNYRLSSNFHGNYDTVWVFEKPLNEYHILSWKIILDEAIRLLKRTGKLIIRMYETPSLTVPMLKNFIGRNINLNVSLDYEYQKDNYYNIVFNIERLDFEIYQDKSWTFAMLTGGKKDDIVIKFLESIRKNEPQKSQIIISGPKKDIYDEYDVEYLDLSNYRDSEYAEISKKKNDIAKMATGANIAIVHDRYYLQDNFFKDFEEYGYDFDFLAIKQISETTENEVPSYCYTYNKALEHTHVGYNACFSQLLDTQYVNGGIIVAKTKTLQKIKFCSLIFWNQKEDVELTNEFVKHSIIPRVGFLPTVYTTRDISDYPWDYYDGNTFQYKCSLTKEQCPTIYGIENNIGKLKLFSLAIYPKNKFPYVGLRIKFCTKRKDI